MSYFENIDGYKQFFTFSFQALRKLSQEDKELFNDLFYNRTPEYHRIISMLKNIRNRGDNILIIGDAGVGKSSFMYRILYDSKLIDEFNLFPLIVDYGDSMNQNICLMNFITDMEGYFKAIEMPINSLLDNIENNIDINIHSLQKHLSQISRDNLQKHLIIFLDDFDYLEENLFSFLKNFFPFASSNKISVILSVRPPLYSAIECYDSRFKIYFTSDVQRIELQPMTTQKLLKKRLAVVLHPESQNVYQTIVSKFLNHDSIYKKLLINYGITNIEQLEKIYLPFTHLYLNFMNSITNGNIREIFDITHDSLVYIFLHYENIETVEEEDDGIVTPRKKLDNKHVMMLFTENQVLKQKDKYKGTYRLFNLNEFKSKNKNSLIYNVLEAIKIFEYLNADFYENLESMGHSRDSINRIVKIIANKKNRLIVPTKILPEEDRESSLLYEHYKTTMKGDYYLTNIAFWDEYKEVFGEFGNSLRNKVI